MTYPRQISQVLNHLPLCYVLFSLILMLFREVFFLILPYYLHLHQIRQNLQPSSFYVFYAFYASYVSCAFYPFSFFSLLLHFPIKLQIASNKNESTFRKNQVLVK